ncbi:hypothetical protein B0H13DRAFT_2355491 [Mycena leptocephala]|nr:hypothetical protein B0H13DRAFT_2355491 [Mycena leptocephala]
MLDPVDFTDPIYPTCALTVSVGFRATKMLIYSIIPHFWVFSFTLSRNENKEKRKALQEDINKFIDTRLKIAEKIAEKHNVRLEHVMGRLMSLSCFKPAQGNELTWAEAKDRVRTEDEFRKADKKQKAVFRTELEADNLKKMRGTRATNNAAAADGRSTVKRIGEEASRMTALAGRTGMVGFAMFTRSHVHDRTQPAEMESWGGLDFFHDVLKMDPEM